MEYVLGMDAAVFIAVRDDIQKFTYFFKAFLLGRAVEMSHTASLCMDICTAESRSSNIFVGYAFDNFWPGYKHLADVVDHKR